MKSSLFPVLALGLLFLSPPRDAGAEEPPYTPVFFPGNSFLYVTSTSWNLSQTSHGAAIRFTATENADATSVHVYLGDATATSLTFGLQADNGSGAPSGTFLASGTVTPVAGWNSISFEGQSLVAGQMYHVVSLPVASGRARLRRLVMSDPVAMQTYGIQDTGYGYRTISGGNPGELTNADTLNVVVGTDSGRGIGLAYYNTSSPFVSDTTPLAQRFQFNAAEPGQALLESITLRLSAGTDLKDVRLTLLDDSHNVLATSLFGAGSLNPGVADSYTFSFADGPVLSEDAYYRIALTTEGEGANSVRWMSAITGSSELAINSATFQGTDGYVFAYSDLTFSSVQGIALDRDYLFSYSVTAIPEPGVTVLTLLALASVAVARRRRGSQR